MLDLKADVELKAGDLDDDTKTLRNRERKMSRSAVIPGSYQAAAAALTYGFLAFPAPTPGKIWEILEICVSGQDPFTTIAGQALAYVAQQVPQDSNNEPAGFPQMIGVPVTIPNVLEKARRSTILRGNDRVILCMKGLANAAQIQASMSIIEHDMATYFERLES